MYMTKNKILFWIFTALASTAVALGFCLLFLGVKDITDTPNSVEINVVDGDYYLSTDYNSKFCYEFKFEQKVGDDFIVLNKVESKTNSIKFDDANIDLQAGDTYRFSARYINENGSGNSDFCKAYTWLAGWTLDKVENVTFDSENEILSWKKCFLADSYCVTILDKNGESGVYKTIDNSFDLSQIEAGCYSVFVSATSENEHLKDSIMSDIIEITLIRKNHIYYGYYDGTLYLICTQHIQQFVVYADGQQIAIVEADQVYKQGGNYYYVLEDAGIYMQNYSCVQIKSLQNQFILESDLIELS